MEYPIFFKLYENFYLILLPVFEILAAEKHNLLFEKDSK